MRREKVMEVNTLKSALLSEAQNTHSQVELNTSLFDLLYMLSGVYNISTSIPTWKKYMWNIYPALAHFFALAALICTILNTLQVNSLILRLSQTSLCAMNLVAFYALYVSRKRGSSIELIPLRRAKYIFVLGIIFTIAIYTVYIVSFVLTPQTDLWLFVINLLLSVPVLAFQTITVGMYMLQFHRIVTATLNDLDALEEKNDAKMLHKHLVEAHDECFLHFKKYVAFPFVPFFCFSVLLVVFNLIAIYMPKLDDSRDPTTKATTLMIKIIYPTIARK
jgi:hypothetical protein